MDLLRLRHALRPLVLELGRRHTHHDLPHICESLQLPSPSADDSKTKAQRAGEVADAIPDADLPRAASALLRAGLASPRARFELQEILWSDGPCPEISKRLRHELARAIQEEPLYLDWDEFEHVLEELWILENEETFASFLLGAKSLREEIQQHVCRNPDDWSAEELFKRLGAFNASDRRFARFVEALASPAIRPDEPSQRRFVAAVNGALAAGGAELRECGEEGRYPVFAIVSARSLSSSRPKNIIFASSEKPDIRIPDLISNDIEILTNADKVLVYDRPISRDGLRWRDLQEWWGNSLSIADSGEAKNTLYKRLESCLPSNSPPQRLLFDAYHRTFRNAIPDLPALLPEVWLHWDYQTVKERGPDALKRFRMDFLMLLPGGTRVVIEVDGRHHYANKAGQADPHLYGEMMGADRDLRLAGYEVFRFGADELRGDDDRARVREFFERLFKQHRVNVE